MGRKKKQCDDCGYYLKENLKVVEHHPAKSVPDFIDKQFGYCGKYGDILPNNTDLLKNMARGCEYYEKEEIEVLT